MVNAKPSERASATRWSTALVEPPSAMMTVSALSNAARVMICFGVICRSRSTRMAAPARRHSAALSGSVAGVEELYGSVMPSASDAVDIVLAVYMPPHAPAPGQACRTTAFIDASVRLPCTNSPYTWNTDAMSMTSPS